MKKPIHRFLLRWFVSALGLWIAAGFLGGRITYDSQVSVLVIAGLILAIINSLVKPIVVLLSLPFILFSLGLFLIVINGFMVWLVGQIYSPLHVGSFGVAMLAGIIIGLVNWLVTTIVEDV